MDIGFAVHGTKGSIEFTSEEPTEMRLYKTSDPASESGFRAIPVGPAHPGAELSGRSPAWRSGSGMASSSRCATSCAPLPMAARPNPLLDGLRASEVVAAAQASAATRSWQRVERLDLSQELECG